LPARRIRIPAPDRIFASIIDDLLLTICSASAFICGCFHVVPRNAEDAGTREESYEWRTVRRATHTSPLRGALADNTPDSAESLAVRLAAAEDRRSDVIAQAFETRSRGGAGDHCLFLLRQTDVDLRGPLHEGRGLRRSLAGLDHCRDRHAQSLLRSLVALLRRAGVGENRRQLDGRADVAETGNFRGQALR
jgi:hypothetical protein